MTEIEKFEPCFKAVEFRKQYDTFKEAWEACPRGDWMLWIAEKLELDKRLLVLTSAHCANTVRHLMEDERSTRCVDVCIAYGEGKATEEELTTARDAARDAASAAARDAAWDAAGDDAAWAAARAAAWAAAGAAAWDAARATNEIQGAAVMRDRGQPFFFLPMFGFATPEEIV